MIAFGEGMSKTDKTAYDIAIKELENNPNFIQTIAGIVRVYPKRTLILVEHRVLGHALEQAIPGSVFIHGDTSNSARWEAIHDFENDKLDCLIGGKIIKRGLDLKGGCDNLIIAHGMKDMADFEQRIGRAIRKNKEGFARVFDFMFLHNTHLYGHSRARLKYLANMGYNSVVVYPQADIRIDGTSLIRSRFRVPHQK
jgi:superfamily II DNA or RNA helicase